MYRHYYGNETKINLIKISSDANKKLLFELKNLIKCQICNKENNENIIAVHSAGFCCHYENKKGKINIHEKCISSCNYCNFFFCKTCLDKYNFFQKFVLKKLNCKDGCDKYFSILNLIKNIYYSNKLIVSGILLGIGVSIIYKSFNLLKK